MDKARTILCLLATMVSLAMGQEYVQELFVKTGRGEDASMKPLFGSLGAMICGKNTTCCFTGYNYLYDIGQGTLNRIRDLGECNFFDLGQFETKRGLGGIRLFHEGTDAILVEYAYLSTNYNKYICYYSTYYDTLDNNDSTSFWDMIKCVSD